MEPKWFHQPTSKQGLNTGKSLYSDPRDSGRGFMKVILNRNSMRIKQEKTAISHHVPTNELVISVRAVMDAPV